MSDFDFNAALPARFKAVNHNKTDHARYREAQKAVEENFSEVTKEKDLEGRRENLRIWDSKTPARWRKATLSKLPGDVAKPLLESLKNKNHSAYFTGNEGSGKTYAGYAMIRRMIGSGIIQPSGVRVYSEANLIELSRAGFAGRDKIQAYMDDKKTSLIMLDGIGFADDYSDREALTIERLIERAYSENLPLVVTGVIDPGKWVKRLSESTEGRLQEMIGKAVFTLPDRNTESAF